MPEAAVAVGLSISTIRRLINSGRLPARYERGDKGQHRYFIAHADLATLADLGTAPAPGPRGSAAGSFHSAISAMPAAAVSMGAVAASPGVHGHHEARTAGRPGLHGSSSAPPVQSRPAGWSSEELPVAPTVPGTLETAPPASDAAPGAHGGPGSQADQAPHGAGHTEGAHGLQSVPGIVSPAHRPEVPNGQGGAAMVRAATTASSERWSDAAGSTPGTNDGLHGARAAEAAVAGGLQEDHAAGAGAPARDPVSLGEYAAQLELAVMRERLGGAQEAARLHAERVRAQIKEIGFLHDQLDQSRTAEEQLRVLLARLTAALPAPEPPPALEARNITPAPPPARVRWWWPFGRRAE